MTNKCALLVTSCDSYCDAWNPYFTLLSINWADNKYPIYLNTEEKDYSFPGLNIQCLYSKKNDISWSQRLKQALNRIESEYIIFMLEDFFIKQPVRSDMIENCLHWMDEDEKVVFIDFYHDRTENDDLVCGEFSEIERNNDWAINANCAIWRKQFLLDILRDENPWDFEMNATARWRRTDYKIYTHRKEFPPIFDYVFETVNGPWSGIIKGKWLSSVPYLFNQYGIYVDYSKRGLIDPPYNLARNREKYWFFHDIIKIVKKPSVCRHYFICTVNVIKDKIKRFWRKYLNY